MTKIKVTKRDIARELARKYSTMTIEDLSLLEAILEERRYKKGENILKKGDVCSSIYYIYKGLTRQYYFKNDREITEYLGVDGNIVMCIESLFKEEPTYLELEAIENTVLFELPKKELESVALHNVNIQLLYRKILEESLILSQYHADLVRFEKAHDRYAKFCRYSPQVALRAPLLYIASYLQMTPETLSRVRSS